VRAWLAVAMLAATLDPLFSGGETLDYSLSWLYLPGGAMRMTIGPDPTNPFRYRVTSIAASGSGFALIFKVRDEIVSLVARDDFTTERYEKHLNERGKKKDDVTTIDPTHRIATRVRPGKKDQVFPVTRPIFDPLSLVYHLRTLSLQPGTMPRFPVFSDGKVYTLEARVTKRETVGTPLGSFKTVVVEPTMQGGGLFSDDPGSLTIWYSDDERHLPVQIRTDLKVGSIIATLKGVRAGVNGIEPALK
jgi:hypothetical protein